MEVSDNSKTCGNTHLLACHFSFSQTSTRVSIAPQNMIQLNLSNTDTEGAEQSVHNIIIIIERCLLYKGHKYYVTLKASLMVVL